ncbi:cortical protein marker for cell polarity-domain-containing protein [Aspergillus egyptiacus]|nr:cortical protein marker for cell polarity-domain-containing protein [Aspergillus egyptiacus]
MRFPSLFGPAAAGSSAVLQLWLTSQISHVSALSFQPVAQPDLDLSRLGHVALTGDFDAVTFYSYAEQSKTHAADNNSQSILTPLPNGIITELTTSDGDISAMCTFSGDKGGNSEIFVGGNFTSLGGVEAHGIALYEPDSNSVRAIPGLSGRVSTLLCDRKTNSVYVGGTFEQGNSSNAAAWVRGDGWKELSFGGFNGPVTSIIKDIDGHIIFGGSFDGIGNSTSSSSKRNEQVINLQDATITSSTESTRSGFNDPRNIVCSTGNDGEGETWLLGDYALGFWRADMRFNFKPSKLRLYNTHLEGRGTKSFLFRRLPDNGIMNMTYTDPETGDDVNCDQYCFLSDSNDEEYREFHFVNYVGMTGFQIEVRDWYGTGAGLNKIELFTNDLYTYAINDFNEPTCADVSHSSSATQAGSWTVTESDGSPSDYLAAQVSDSDADSTSIVFEPDIKRSGNYSILVSTPGCGQDGTCDSRGIVNVTATVRSDSEAAEPIEKQIHQTNRDEKYDTIYSGPVDPSDDSFRPRVTLSPIAGQGDITIVASRVKFELLSDSNDTSGELNGLYDYDPASTNVTANLLDSYVNRAGAQLNSKASIQAMVNHAGVIYAAGNFSNSDVSHIFSLEADSNVTAMPQGGLNSEVTTMAVLNDTLYVGGNFTGTSSSGGSDNLNYVAAYSSNSRSWSALGGGVNGPVKGVFALPLNVSTDLNETIIAVSGEFDELLAFDGNPAVTVSGFAAWIPSRNNWVQNLNVSQTHYSGHLSDFVRSNDTTILAGSLVSGGIAAGGAVSLLHDDELQLDPLLSSTQSSGETVTGIYDRSSGRNLTILGGHFNLVTDDGSTLRNLAFLKGGNGIITGLGSEVDNNSTFLTLAVADDILYAGGKVTGSVDGSQLNGLVFYDLENSTFAQDQPPKFNGDDVFVKAIAPRPDSKEVYVGGQFAAAGSLPCSGVCYYDTERQQWNRPGVELEGSVVALKWAQDSLIAIGNLTVGGNETAVATYSTEEMEWKAFEGASASSIPGAVTAFTPANPVTSSFWLAGQSEDGSSFVVNYDGSTFHPAQKIFGTGTVIRGLDVLPLASDHDHNDLLNKDLTLLITGQIEVPDFGIVSAALFNGTTLTPFILSSTSDGRPGRMSQMFYENENPYARKSNHHSNGIVILVAFCCALGCVFLIVIAGVIFNKIQRRRQGYMAAPQAAGTDRPTSMRRLPPEYLFNSLKRPNLSPPTV